MLPLAAEKRFRRLRPSLWSGLRCWRTSRLLSRSPFLWQSAMALASYNYIGRAVSNTSIPPCPHLSKRACSCCVVSIPHLVRKTIEVSRKRLYMYTQGIHTCSHCEWIDHLEWFPPEGQLPSRTPAQPSPRNTQKSRHTNAMHNAVWNHAEIQETAMKEIETETGKDQCTKNWEYYKERSSVRTNYSQFDFNQVNGQWWLGIMTTAGTGTPDALNGWAKEGESQPAVQHGWTVGLVPVCDQGWC